jgi:anti-sigma factor RsiW
VNASGGPSPAEQHLGDRLAALVDGELEHDTRERVLAHLATCGRCKAEADAQRRLKSVFAETAPPPPSEGLLARLQGLPGGDADTSRGPFGGGRGGFGSGGAGFGMSPEGFGYVGQGAHGPRLPGADRDSGFRIHDVGAAERSASRGRRFAFAAAGAVSLAAIALGGALPLNAAVDSTTRGGEGSGSNVTPRASAPSAAPRAADGSPGTTGGPTEEGTRTGGSGLFAAVEEASDSGLAAPLPAATAPPPTPLSHPFAKPMLTGLGTPPLILAAAADTIGATESQPMLTPAPTQLAASSPSPGAQISPTR